MRTRRSHQLLEVEVMAKATGHDTLDSTGASYEEELLEALSPAQKYVCKRSHFLKQVYLLINKKSYLIQSLVRHIVLGYKEACPS